MNRSRVFVCACALLAAAPCFAGSIANGSFETGDFTGWSTIGPASVGNYSPTDGLVDAKLSSMSSFDSDAVNTFFGAHVVPADFGTGIQTTITLDASEALVFDWRVFSGENAGPFGDYGFYVIDGVRVNLFNDPGYPVPGFLDQKTAYLNLAAGTHTLGFAVMNFGDMRGETDLFIDNVRLANAAALGLPVPAGAGLPMLGLCAVVIHRRRHCRTPA